MKCPNCEGKGEVEMYNYNCGKPGETMYYMDNCQFCGGTGEVRDEEEMRK